MLFSSEGPVVRLSRASGPGGCAFGPEGVVAPALQPCRSAALAGGRGCGCCCACCTAQSPGRCGRGSRSCATGFTSAEQAQPAKGVDALVRCGMALFGHAGAAHAVKAVAAGDEVAGCKGVRLAVLLIRHAGRGAVKVHALARWRLRTRWSGPQRRGRPSGLASPRSGRKTMTRLPPVKLVHVDAVALALEQQLQSRRAAGLRHGRGRCTPAWSSRSTRDLSRRASADAADQRVAGAALLDDDGIDAGLVEQLRRAAGLRGLHDDGNFGYACLSTS